jgi:protocatechuate 3,4-dioxygenase beta subunit
MNDIDDDKPRGRILNRREVLSILGAGGGALAAGAWTIPSPAWPLAAAQQPAAPSGCVVRPEQTEGPYFLDGQLERSDIRIDPTTGAKKDGRPLALAFTVSQIGAGSCSPLAGAIVDVWHCDAAGAYSGFNDAIGGFQTTGQKFLRGYQLTDRNGVARFSTIYPGWYRGRAVHIHFKVRTKSAAGAYEFTSQLYFDDAMSDRVLAQPPYASKGRRDTLNRNDMVFRTGGGSLMLNVKEGSGGYAAAFDLALDLTG